MNNSHSWQRSKCQDHTPQLIYPKNIRRVVKLSTDWTGNGRHISRKTHE